MCNTRNGRPECDNRVAIRQMKNKGIKYPSFSVCCACMEGYRTRAYIKKLFETLKEEY